MSFIVTRPKVIQKAITTTPINIIDNLIQQLNRDSAYRVTIYSSGNILFYLNFDGGNATANAANDLPIPANWTYDEYMSVQDIERLFARSSAANDTLVLELAEIVGGVELMRRYP